MVRKEWNSKEGKEVERVKYVYGYKLLVLMEARDKIVVAARVVKINEHEKNFTKEMIKEAQQRTGGAMRVLLVDGGFIDGRLLWWLSKKMGIKFVIPARSNMPACHRQGGEAKHWGVSFGEGGWSEDFYRRDERDQRDGGSGTSLL